MKDEIDDDFGGSISSLVDELLGVPEGHRRPSAAQTRTVPHHTENDAPQDTENDDAEDQKNRDEL